MCVAKSTSIKATNQHVPAFGRGNPAGGIRQSIHAAKGMEGRLRANPAMLVRRADCGSSPHHVTHYFIGGSLYGI